MLFFLTSSSDHDENLEEFTKRAKAKAKSNYLKLLAAANHSAHHNQYSSTPSHTKISNG